MLLYYELSLVIFGVIILIFGVKELAPQPLQMSVDLMGFESECIIEHSEPKKCTILHNIAFPKSMSFNVKINIYVANKYLCAFWRFTSSTSEFWVKAF